VLSKTGYTPMPSDLFAQWTIEANKVVSL